MSDQFIEYAKLHLISLEQDLENHRPEDVLLVELIEGQIIATRHLLTVYADIKYNGKE